MSNTEKNVLPSQELGICQYLVTNPKEVHNK